MISPFSQSNMAANERLVFVTVGSTSFDALVDVVLSDAVLETLAGLDYTSVVIQHGRGIKREPRLERQGMVIHLYDFKPVIKSDMEKAALIISHAGSGSIMESLRLNKPLIVVINEELMDNHQIELAQALSAQNYLRYSTTSNLKQALLALDPSRLQPFPAAKPERFASIMDSWFGYQN